MPVLLETANLSRLEIAGLPEDVQLWLVNTQISLEEAVCLEKNLAETEIEKAQAFYFTHHRIRYVAAHYYLRLILSRYTGIAATELAFESGACGKPFLVNPGCQELHFNLSHAGDYALVGVSCGNNYLIGVDIEYIRLVERMESIVSSYFSVAEIEDILNSVNRTKSFFDYWTAKEAFLKATGKGLSQPLNSFTVRLNAGAIFNNSGEKFNGHLLNFTPATNYQASLVLLTSE